MSAVPLAASSPGWNPEKVAAYEEAYQVFSSYVRIDSKETGGGTILADNRYESQRVFLKTVWDGLAEDIHDFSVLKSRQLGITTEARALGLFWLCIHDGLRGSMVFDTDAHKEEARLEIEMMITSLPASLRYPKIVPPSNRYLMTFSNGSLIRFMAAGTRISKSSGVLGRASGSNLLLASELCSWNNPEGIISLKQSLAETYENRLYLKESTGRGFNDWHDMWQEALADSLNQRTCFLGWWLKDTQRIERGSAMWDAYGAPEVTPHEQKRIDAVRKQYGYEVSREQLAWYRRKVDPTRERDADEPEDSHQVQEQPWTEEECFLATGSTFFDGVRLSDRMAQAVQYRHKSYKFWPGSDFFASKIDPARTWRETQLKLWEEPLADAVYVVAADPAYGHDEDNDRSAINVLRCYADCLEQVAEFASASTPTHQFAWLILSLAAYYGLYAGTSVMMIVELNGPGEAVWREIMQLRGAIVSGYYREPARERGVGDMINNIKQYVYTRSDAMTAGHSYHWKCLALDTPIPTPNGWSAIDDLREGDQVFDEHGEPCNVIGVSPIHEGHECYAVTFDDKTSIIADADHIWEVDDRGLCPTNLLHLDKRSIAVAQPLQLEDGLLPIDPYVLGVWLGDGASTQGRYYAHKDDIGEMSTLLHGRGFDLGEITVEKGNVCMQAIHGLWAATRKIGTFNNKHIPSAYLRASFPQRLDLMQGLMDTDGSIDRNRQCSFSTSDPAIRDGFAELCRTLGIKPKFLERTRTIFYKGESKLCSLSWQFWFTAYPDLPVFKLSRKRKALRNIGDDVRQGRSRRHKIINVEEVASEPVKCIAVDSRSHLFLAGRGMIPTHNTTSQLKVAIMERLRDYVHNGKLLIRSQETLEEMRSITRDGDTIKAEGRKHDDRAFTLALGIRAYEERLQRALMSGGRTKAADQAKRALSISDQYQLFRNYQLDSFFKQKQAARVGIQRAQQRRSWGRRF